MRASFAFALAAMAIIVGCSGNSNNNPADQMTGASIRAVANGLSLVAEPERIVIDPADPNTPTDPTNGDKRYGETLLTATATDANGVPQADLDVTFGADAGRLASNGQAVKTNAEGIAQDTLRVYEDDPDSIQVSVGEGTRVTSIVVTKLVVAPPVANAGPDQTVECTGGSEAQVRLDGSASTDPNGDIKLYEWFEHFGAADQVSLGQGQILTVSLGLGTHTVTLQVTDATGKSSTDDVVIEVVDTRPPAVVLTVSPSTLWPPNHKLVNITATARVDECGPYTVTLESVTSNEPDNGTGDGDTANDIQGVAVGTSDYEFALRAERSGGGSGRIYTAVYKVVDAGGLETIATAAITVPHDRGGK